MRRSDTVLSKPFRRVPCSVMDFSAEAKRVPWSATDFSAAAKRVPWSATDFSAETRRVFNPLVVVSKPLMLFSTLTNLLSDSFLVYTSALFAFVAISAVFLFTLPDTASNAVWSAFLAMAALFSSTLPDTASNAVWSAFLAIAALFSSTLPDTASNAVWSAFLAIAALFSSMAFLLASMLLPLSATWSATALTASCTAVKRLSAFALFSSIAFLLASMSSRFASSAGRTLSRTPSTIALMSSLFLSIAALFLSIAALFSLIAVSTAFRSSVCWLTTSAVFTNASLFSLTVSVRSARLWSCSATTSFRPRPLKSSASTSASVASFLVILPFSSMS